MRIPGILIILLLLFSGCDNSFRSGRYGSYSDNLEDLRGVDNKITGKNEKFRVGDLPQVQRDTVKSGKNALKLDTSFPYGLNYTIPNVRTDEYVEVSVWCTGPGQLVLVASHQDAKYFYRKSTSISSEGDDWQEVKLAISIPPNMDREDLNIYVWNPGKDPVYADDFHISYREFKSYPEFRADQAIHLMIDTLDILKLENKRKGAFANGVLETADDDYVSGIMYYNDSLMPVDVRLKGDWLDHLEGRKWSFRIKLKKQNTWKHVRAFSIHTPIARDFLNEYVSHRIFRKNDLLSPRYGFVPVTLNGTSLGVYAWEEHFDKQLVESMDRREGPILKFDEGLFWQTQKVFIKDTQYFELPFLEAADILPFKLNRTLRDTALRENFMIAHNLLNQYRFGKRKVSDIFDIDKLAGYFAMMDLTRGFHGEAWHNQRYYYNPIIGKLEPVFFDAYTEEGVFNPQKNAISGLFSFDPTNVKRFENLFWVRVFQDPIFLEEYLSWLEKISDPVWVNDFLLSVEDDISKYENMIRQEFEYYTYDRGFLLENARKIRIELPYFKEILEKNMNYAAFDPDKVKYLQYSEKYDPRFPEYYVNAYLSDSSAQEYIIHIDNYYPREIELTGFGASYEIMDGSLSKPLSVNSYKNRQPESVKLNVGIGSKYIFFRVKDKDSKFAVAINQYPEPRNSSPQQELFYNAGVPDLPFVRMDGNKILFEKGQNVVNQPLIIPTGYELVFEAGCELDFINSSFLISKSPVVMQGEEGNPVKILSSDNSAGGFTVLQAGMLSSLDHVVFSGFNTLDYNGWKLTGAVNFYESDVNINRVVFEDNVCEDALNIIRSEFEVINSRFSNTFADAFDSDFCEGLVEGVEFQNIGNDAIDFSGSIVEIRNCQINQAGDKGVSAGEKSTLSVFETTVEGANIGFASKDQSKLTLDNCSANQTNYALVAFQKKPEYGPGNIKATGFKADGAKTLYLIERFSKLNLNGTIVTGEETGVANLFY